MARGGRGGGSRNPANQPREVQVSRKVSWLLRHGADQEGLKLGKGGYVNVRDAVSLFLRYTVSQNHENTKTGDVELFGSFESKQTSSIDFDKQQTNSSPAQHQGSPKSQSHLPRTPRYSRKQRQTALFHDSRIIT